MRYRVPQNIDMEDKIIGPLTMAQFLYVMFGGMIIYIAFLAFGESAPLLFWVIAVPLGLLTLSLAFLQVNGQPLPKFLGAVLLYGFKPKARIWQKDPASSHIQVVQKQASTPDTPSPTQQTIAKKDLGGLATVLDTGGAENVEGIFEPNQLARGETGNGKRETGTTQKTPEVRESRASAEGGKASRVESTMPSPPPRRSPAGTPSEKIPTAHSAASEESSTQHSGGDPTLRANELRSGTAGASEPSSSEANQQSATSNQQSDTDPLQAHVDKKREAIQHIASQQSAESIDPNWRGS